LHSYRRMDLKTLISRVELAASLGAEPQTIAKWQRLGLMPLRKECLSDRVILYDREEMRHNVRAEEGRASSPGRSRARQRVKRVRNRNRLVGFTYDEAAGVAHFSMYLPEMRKSLIRQNLRYEQALTRLLRWSSSAPPPAA
jgi:hypothetical protein